MKSHNTRLKEIENHIENNFFYMDYYKVLVEDEAPHFYCEGSSFNTQNELDQFIFNDIRRHPTKPITIMFDDMESTYPVDIERYNKALKK